MKIINIESGKPYQLDPETALSVERTNPFFQDYGEQTLPVALPDSPYNRKLLGLPGVVQRKSKVKLVDAAIQDGEYFSVCRQAVLAVTPGESIDTSFYMNDGSFYSRLEDTYITEVFGDETVPGINTVDQAVDWMVQLWKTGGNEQFACFEVEVEDEDGTRRLNMWNMRSNHVGDTFYNAVERVVKYKSSSDENPDSSRVTHDGNLYIPKGFYLTPFLKANFVLQRLFAHFGYTLEPCFLTQIEQFSHMVFINNVADAIVTGTIKLSQLVPKASCKKILDLFRKKFNCEFITNEVDKTVTIVTMNDVLSDSRKIDLTENLCGQLKINYPEEYRQIRLKPAATVGSENESSLDSLALIHSQFPTAYFSKELGCFIRDGFRFKRVTESVREYVADNSQLYYEGENLSTLDIEIPEAIPVSKKSGILFIGKLQYLNSSLRLGTMEENQVIDDEDKSSEDGMELMLAFVYRNAGYTGGTVTNFGSNGYRTNEDYIRIGDYSLSYNGDDGIFEKFYRKYDTLLRNSLHSVEADLLLSQHQKQTIKSTDKLHIDGADYLIDSLNFELGIKKNISESKLLTLQLYEPVNAAKKLDSIVPPLATTGYKWVVKKEEKRISKEDYEKSIYKDAGSPLIFPPVATAADVGKQSYLRKTAIYLDADHAPLHGHEETWWLLTLWLEAVAE